MNVRKFSYGQRVELTEKDVGKDVLFPDGARVSIIGVRPGEPVNGFLVGCFCGCDARVTPRGWERFMEIVNESSYLSKHKGVVIVLVPINDPRAIKLELTRKDLEGRVGIVFRYSTGDAGIDLKPRYIPDRNKDPHKDMPTIIDGVYVGISDTKSSDSMNRKVVIIWDPATNCIAPEVVEVKYGGLTASECLTRYERLMQTTDATPMARDGALLMSNGDILDPVSCEMLLTAKQIEIARVEWSTALKTKGMALKEADRMMVTCEDQHEL